jgi:hypothetical protein
MPVSAERWLELGVYGDERDASVEPVRSHFARRRELVAVTSSVAEFCAQQNVRVRFRHFHSSTQVAHFRASGSRPQSVSGGVP